MKKTGKKSTGKLIASTSNVDIYIDGQKFWTVEKREDKRRARGRYDRNL